MSDTQPFSVHEMRAEFPQLEECVYLNSNSAGLAPRGVESVLRDYWTTLSHWRDEVWQQWWPALLAYGDDLAGLIGAPRGSVVTDSSMSTLLGRLLTCFDFRQARHRIVVSDLEFVTTPFVLRAFERLGAEIVVVPSCNGSTIDLEAMCGAIDERTLLVVASHATYATGALLDVGTLARQAHRFGALMIVDAYQSIGAIPIDVAALEADVLLGGAHKWLCGSYESAFMYVRPSLTKTLEPAATGWMASADPLTFGRAERFADDARRFASGTPAVLPALVSHVGLRLMNAVGVGRARRLSMRQTERIIERADEAELRVISPRNVLERAGIVALSFPGDARVAADMVRRGFVCSHRGYLRIAPHFYNDDAEVDRFLDLLVELATEAKRCS